MSERASRVLGIKGAFRQFSSSHGTDSQQRQSTGWEQPLVSDLLYSCAPVTNHLLIIHFPLGLMQIGGITTAAASRSWRGRSYNEVGRIWNSVFVVEDADRVTCLFPWDLSFSSCSRGIHAALGLRLVMFPVSPFLPSTSANSCQGLTALTRGQWLSSCPLSSPCQPTGLIPSPRTAQRELGEHHP